MEEQEDFEVDRHRRKGNATSTMFGSPMRVKIKTMVVGPRDKRLAERFFSPKKTGRWFRVEATYSDRWQSGKESCWVSSARLPE